MVKRQQGGYSEDSNQSFLSGLWGSRNSQPTSSGWFGSNDSQPTSTTSGWNNQPTSTSTGWFGSNATTISTKPQASSGLTFQKIVSYIAAIILAGTLTVIGFMIYNSQSTLEYPPEVAECPDYWESTGPGKCRNTLKVGKCTDTDEMDFNDPKYSGPTGLAEKCKWANSCGLVWDGLKC